ncbi:hypothetical protein HanRHA438_Chr08g0346201 [Helianthus annuus]|nr:hypothetical protein HanRHA438_Chr08g0346201 [Helianthus annuus]
MNVPMQTKQSIMSNMRKMKNFFQWLPLTLTFTLKDMSRLLNEPNEHEHASCSCSFI